MGKEFKARQVFIEEARMDLLPELENTLLELSDNPDDPELINRAFRALHTLKGSGAMFGFDRLSELAHEIETVFDNVRNNSYQVDDELLKLTFAAKDLFQLLVNHPDDEAPETIDDLQKTFRQIASMDAPEENSAADLASTEKDADSLTWSVFHIRFKPQPGIFMTGTNPLFLLDELNELGTTCVIAHPDNIPLLESLDPEACYIWWDILLATDKEANTIKDVFIFVEDDCELTIELVADNVQPGHETAAFDHLGRVLCEDETITEDELKHLFSTISSSSEDDLNKPADNKKQARRRSDSQSTGETSQPSNTISSMRVQAGKLDKLVNLVGEMVIAQTRLSRLADEKEDATLSEIAEVIERLSNDLRENTLDIRMLPIGASFGKFKRVVWDISTRRGKSVELVTEGAATELDKTVIERLDNPLVHLLRNSIDHGIESPEERKHAGKPQQGKITFSAEHSGGEVIITISDDGQGIDPEVVKAKAIEKGILPPDAAPGEKELMDLIFEPGFSTAGKVSDISGRGVGMDVVKQNITALRGKVSVSSEKGRGTTIKMTIPLTLAIIDGLEVKIDQQHYIVPLAAVSECLELARGEDGSQENRFINLRDRLVPFLRLRDWFSVTGQAPDKEQVVIVAAEKDPVGLVVDEVVGLQQTVIKNLGDAYKDTQGVSGATIQGDGSIALILDVEPLILKAENNQNVS